MTAHWDRGRRVTDWWVERPPAGSPFLRRWVRTPEGWDYEDRMIEERVPGLLERKE